jgi:alkylation response protein AidB-like acyl-CoA dehydrogenase
VQIHGAQGCGPDAPVGRYFRDAQVMEIIEGSTQLQQLLIADHALRAHASRSQSIEASK